MHNGSSGFTQLGDELRKATTKPEEEKVPPPAIWDSTKRNILEVIKSNRDQEWRTQLIIDELEKRGVKVSPAACYATLRTLKIEKIIVCTRHGVYKWKSESKQPVTPPLKGVLLTPVPSVIQATVEDVQAVAGVKTGDPEVDADLARLDHALAGLSEIEEVITKYRKIILEAAKLKKMLAGINL